MSEAVYFVIERTEHGQQPAIYYDRLSTRLSTYKAMKDGTGRPIVMRDLKGNVIDLNPLVYAVRLDRLPNGAELAAKPLPELYAMYRRLCATGKLPPPNLADPPRPKGEQGTLIGEAFEVRNPPWHDQPREHFPIALFCPHCRDVVPPGRHHLDCPEQQRVGLNRS